MAAALNGEQLQLLHTFLVDHNMTTKRIHQHYSDPVAVARLLKKFYPRSIELHNYPVRSGFKRKLDNWQTLNSKVLRPLRMKQSDACLVQMAAMTPGIIEKLLWRIMLRWYKTNGRELSAKDCDESSVRDGTSEQQTQQKIHKISTENTKENKMKGLNDEKTASTVVEPKHNLEEVGNGTNDSNKSSKATKCVQFKDEPVDIGDSKRSLSPSTYHAHSSSSGNAEGNSDFVPYLYYKVTLQDLHAKDEIIKSLRKKHAHLKNLLRLKSEQIDALISNKQRQQQQQQQEAKAEVGDKIENENGNENVETLNKSEGLEAGLQDHE